MVAVVERGVDWTTAAVVANVRSSCSRRRVIIIVVGSASRLLDVNRIRIMKCKQKDLQEPVSSIASHAYQEEREIL